MGLSSLKLINPTGAGDTYLAAFIRSLDFFSKSEEQGIFAVVVVIITLKKKEDFDENLDYVLKRSAE